MSNVVSLKAVRTQKECERLFEGYKRRVSLFNKDDFAAEMERFQKELRTYPNHLLTLVKGRILLKELLARGSKNPATLTLLSDIENKFRARSQELPL